MSTTNLKKAQAEATREAVMAALAKTDGNRTQAAELLGISRTQLYRYMRGLRLLRGSSASRGSDGRFGPAN